MYVLFRTPIGLAVRMAGESPAAMEVQGIDFILFGQAQLWLEEIGRASCRERV